jgi:hypothetical protein
MLDAIKQYRRWLIVVAHYDDEALLFGNLLWELYRHERHVTIAVLTSAARSNAPPSPPKTPAEELREQVRQACRLGAFARVCMDCRVARATHFAFPQLWDAREDNRLDLTKSLRLLLTRHFDQNPYPDVVVAHSPHGDYAVSEFPTGYERARMQHVWANELARWFCGRGLDEPRMPLFELSGDGPHVCRPIGAKPRLLAYYRVGCTQAASWDAEKLYPQFVAGDERYRRVEFPSPLTTCKT